MSHQFTFYEKNLETGSSISDHWLSKTNRLVDTIEAKQSKL